MSGHRVIALLGRQDAPTDAVQEYCQYLGEALRAHDFALELARVSWVEDGWPAAMRELERQAGAWRGCWVLVQYTASGMVGARLSVAISARATDFAAGGRASGDGVPRRAAVSRKPDDR